MKQSRIGRHDFVDDRIRLPIEQPMPQQRRILKQFLDRHIEARRQPMQRPRMRPSIAARAAP